MENKNRRSIIANRIFYALLALLILGSVGVTFVKVAVLKNYQIVAETSCDPQTEKCFLFTCDPIDDSTCPMEESERTSYYKMVSKKASNIILCEATVEKYGCATELSCTPGESSCSYTYCDPDNLAEDEVCAEQLNEIN